MSIAREPAAGVSVVGKGTVFRVLPGPAAFPKKIPEELLAAGGSDASPFSQNIAVLPGGQVRFASIDRTVNDTKLSQDWMVFEASVTDEEGNAWRIVQIEKAPFSPIRSWIPGTAG